ncbi:MAG: hypothetical protein ILO43_02210 [Clostridia bacterium]|nr:hypothetical protein [Clostridia bacterium]
MAMNEDRDIKIFGDEGAEVDAAFLRQIETLDHHRQNGNVEKARALGRKLYNIVMDEETKKEIGDPDFAEGKLYVKTGVLAMFSTEAALNMFLPSAQLSTIAISELHRLLAKTESPIYEKVMESPAYSFYYLNIRKGGDVATEIGKAFAMNCRHEGEEKYIAQGRYIYERILQEVQHQIDKFGFAD